MDELDVPRVLGDGEVVDEVEGVMVKLLLVMAGHGVDRDDGGGSSELSTASFSLGW